MKKHLTVLLVTVPFALATFAGPAMGAAVHECVAAKPTPASYSWNFQHEANNIFQAIQWDAQHALNQADRLQAFAHGSELDWEAHADKLNAIKSQVNDIGNKLCRLETIRRVVAPWQQKEIDRIAATLPLMADNTRDAILFLQSHKESLWMPTYQMYADNLYNEAHTLTNTVDNAVAYANVSHEYRHLEQKVQKS